jgi:prophage DNA circulation protein
MGAAAKKSASAYKMSKEVDGLDLKSRANDKTANEIKGRISEADKKIEVLEQKALASPQNFSKSEAKELADLKKVRLDSEQELAELSDASNMGKRDIAKQRAEIDHMDSDVKIMTQRAHAMQGLFSGIAQSVKGLGDLISSGLKFNASQTQVEADKRRLEKDLESSSEQASLDSYQQLRESLGKAVQMMSALEQTLSTSITSIIRTSV